MTSCRYHTSLLRSIWYTGVQQYRTSYKFVQQHLYVDAGSWQNRPRQQRQTPSPFHTHISKRELVLYSSISYVYCNTAVLLLYCCCSCCVLALLLCCRPTYILDASPHLCCFGVCIIIHMRAHFAYCNAVMLLALLVSRVGCWVLGASPAFVSWLTTGDDTASPLARNRTRVVSATK